MYNFANLFSKVILSIKQQRKSIIVAFVSWNLAILLCLIFSIYIYIYSNNHTAFTANMQIVTKQTFAPNITTYTMKNGVFTLEEPPLFFGNNLNPQIARDSVRDNNKTSMFINNDNTIKNLPSPIDNHITTKNIYLDSNKQPNTIYYLYDIKLRFPSNIFRTQKHITSIVIDSIQWDNTIQENHIIGIKRDSLYDNRITLLSLQDIGDSGIVGNVSYHVNLAESLFLNILVFYVIGGILLITGIIIIKIPIIYNNIWYILSLVLISIGILARISQYIWHKDLWLDEAMLAYSIYNLPFADIFFQPLPYTQAAPLGFLSIAKLLGIFFGYSEQVLYFFPFICGIGVLIVAYKIGRNLSNEFLSFLFILLTVGSAGLIYHATNFKQYETEAFCSFLLLYLFIKNTSLRTFSLVSIVCILFSNTIIFIILACIVGYFYQARIQDSNKNFFTFSLSFIKTNGLYIGGILAFFLLYYILYIRYQAVQGFYTYWDKFFLPHSLSAYPQYFKEVWATTAARFTVFSTTRFVPFYMTISALGLLATYLCNRKLCIMMTLSIIIAIGQGPQSNIVSTSKDIDTNKRGLIQTTMNGETTRDGVFAAGDVVYGAKTVVEAVAVSKMVAKEIEDYCYKKRAEQK